MKLLSPLLFWLHELSKGPGKRGHIVAHDVSWARKRAGYKINVVFPCYANWETFVVDTKCLFVCVCPGHKLCPQQILRAQANGETFLSATMCPRLPGP